MLGSTPLPYHSMQRNIHFATLQEAHEFVDHLRRNAAAMRVVTNLLRKVDGSLPDGSLLARFQICGKTYTSCTHAYPVWHPASPDAAMCVLAN